jgi:hypothetical protein
MVGHYGVRLIDFFVLLVMLSTVISGGFINLRLKILVTILYLLGFSCLAFTSTIWALNQEYSVGLRDILEALRYISYIIPIIFGYTWAVKSSPPQFERIFFRLVLVIFLVNFLLSFAEAYFPEYVASISSLYSPFHQRKDITRTGRVLGLFGNPNINGIMILLVGTTLIMRHICHGKSINAVLFFILMIYNVLLAGSKTSLIIMLTLLCLVLIIYFAVSPRLTKFIITLSTIVFFINLPILKEFSPPYINRVIDSIYNLDLYKILQERTFQLRLAHWKAQSVFFFDSPIIGLGPLRTMTGSIADNFYLYIAMRYGLFGLFYYTIGVLLIIGVALKNILNGSEWQFSTVLILQLFVILIGNMTLEAQIVIPASNFFMIYLGCYLGYIENETMPRSI